MDIHKEANRIGLRFVTPRGNLSTEQLWQLSLNELDGMAVALEADYKESGKKSFLVKKSAKDTTTKLRFDIVVDILTTKVEEAETLANARDNKEFNAKIDMLILEKKEAGLKEKSIAELEKLRKK